MMFPIKAWRYNKIRIENSYDNGVYKLTCEIMDAIDKCEPMENAVPKLRNVLSKFELRATLMVSLSLETLSKEERLSRERSKYPIEESSSDLHGMLDILRKVVGDSDPDRKPTMLKMFNTACELNEKYQYMKPPSWAAQKEERA